ncbi:MAG: OmpH family outer membrane protein [Alphaproteobacteria bacterium]|nr:OmpH family outer membrane protein [Alphaproteobacteria bacterium]
MMKKRTKRLLLGAIILGIGAPALYALYKIQHTLNEQVSMTHAIQTSREIKGVAVVDMSRVRLESEPFKALHAFMEEKQSEASQLIFNRENELREAYNDLLLQEKKAEKDNENLLQKRQTFEKGFAELEQMSLQQKNALNEQFRASTTHIEKKLKTIIDGIAAKMKVALVINSSLSIDAPIILFSMSGLDITDDVIATLNSSISELDLPS